nr:NADP-dependent isocitrate dehydrogenase [Sedimentibacter sp.]
MDKIKMNIPVVELDGDEMTRIIWALVKDKLLKPYIDLKTEYYDLHLTNRDNTNDQVTIEAANAIRKYGVGVKCATITANDDRKVEYNLKNVLKSPNGTIRKILDGTVFRKPIAIETLTPIIPNWKKPITIARHSYGDIYSSSSLAVEEGTKAEIVLTDKNNKETRTTIFDFKEKGIVMGEYNLDSSIAHFAETCFKHAIEEKSDLIFSTKDTVVKTYDYKFKDIFNELYKSKYEDTFHQLGLNYTYTLIDDAVSKVIKSKGGMIWACKNYDGDVMSDMVATGFGSLALMTSVLISPDGSYEYEAAHGTVTRHYYNYLKGEKTSTNPIAIIFAWTGALRKRGELDSNQELINFSNCLEKSCISIINKGILTKDLFEMSNVKNKKWVNTEELIESIAQNMQIQ